MRARTAIAKHFEASFQAFVAFRNGFDHLRSVVADDSPAEEYMTCPITQQLYGRSLAPAAFACAHGPCHSYLCSIHEDRRPPAAMIDGLFGMNRLSRSGGDTEIHASGGILLSRRDTEAILADHGLESKVRCALLGLLLPGFRSRS